MGHKKAVATTAGVSARMNVLSAEELSEAIDANPLAKSADNFSRLFLGIMAYLRDRTKLSEIAKQDWGRRELS